MKYGTDRSEAVKMTYDYLSGYTARQIADKYNLEHNTSLKNWLKREAKKINGTGKRRKNENTRNSM